jgi:hypothetical protein
MARDKKLDNYSDFEVEESFAAVFSHAAAFNYLNSYNIISGRNEETGVREVKVEIPGMCESPTVEKFKELKSLHSFSFKMIVDGKTVDLILDKIVQVNDREYTAIYVEGSAPTEEKTTLTASDDGITLSLT